MRPLRILGAAAAIAVCAAAAVAAIGGTGGAPIPPRPSTAEDRPQGPAPSGRREQATPPREMRIRRRDSRAIGDPGNGRLAQGVLMPAAGPGYFTWDPVLRRAPNRAWRRWGTDDLVRLTRGVIGAFSDAHPSAARVGIGDLSRPRGGDFGPRFGYIGHATHQNGLDVDVYYPRRDRRERPPDAPGEVDLRLAQDLLDRFLRAGAVVVYVGPSLALHGPDGVVVPAVHHDNHMHVRIAPPAH